MKIHPRTCQAVHDYFDNRQPGLGKAAIYRRWSSKAALLTDALVYWRPELLSDNAPNTGSLAGDLHALVERAERNDNCLITNDLVLRVALEAAHDAELATALDDLILFRARRVLSAVLAEAAERGEISATRDWSLVADVMTALGLLRVISGQSVDGEFVPQVTDTLILRAVTKPDQ